jgi:hypothetical protein
MSLAKIRAEGKRAIEGAWVNGQIHGLGDELQLKVRGRWNPEFRALHAKLQAQVPNSRKTRTEFGMEITPAEGDRIITECLIETVLVDWKGLTLTDDDPEQLPFSKEKARELLTDPELAPFRDGVLIASGHVAKEGKEVFEADAKN